MASASKVTSATALDGQQWNTLLDRWLDVLQLDGRLARKSPIEALESAPGIRRIAAASSLDHFAAIRFLVTLLYWRMDHSGGVEKLRASLLDNQLPGAVLEAIAGEKDRFNLFDENAPFLQDVTAPAHNTKSAGSFFAECACATNLAHFHHGDDEQMRLCLPCVTSGMLRLVPWTQSGGSGLSASVHGAPPIMVLAEGPTLATTLGLNLVDLEGEAGEPKWTGCFLPSNPRQPIPWLEAFTWNPRRVRVPRAHAIEVCWRCGERNTAGLGRVVYVKNEATRNLKVGKNSVPFQWRDPCAFYDRAASGKQGSERSYSPVRSSEEATAADETDLRRISPAPGMKAGAKRAELAAQIVQQNPSCTNWHLIVPCTNPANNKTLDHRETQLHGAFQDGLRKMCGGSAPPRERQMSRRRFGDRPPRPGMVRFVQSANRLLISSDWAELAAAGFREMHESPAAFDVLTGILWPLRRAGPPPPRPNVGWLVLKLMAAVPSAQRASHAGGVSPARLLPDHLDAGNARRDPNEQPYPLLAPRGHELERSLRAILEKNLRKRRPDLIDWPALCDDLDQLLNPTA